MSSLNKLKTVMNKLQKVKLVMVFMGYRVDRRNPLYFTREVDEHIVTTLPKTLSINEAVIKLQNDWNFLISVFKKIREHYITDIEIFGSRLYLDFNTKYNKLFMVGLSSLSSDIVLDNLVEYIHFYNETYARRGVDNK
jgi:hypothetical protein